MLKRFCIIYFHKKTLVSFKVGISELLENLLCSLGDLKNWSGIDYYNPDSDQYFRKE
jgi:hypothetical protein